MRARIPLVLAGALLAIAPPAAGAAPSARLPLQVHAASLTQGDQQLVWQVELDHPFSPTGLKHDRRSLCLAIRRARNVYQNVVGNAHYGSIVIQHDGGGHRAETLVALPREIDTLRGKGYQCVTVTDLLGQRLIYKCAPRPPQRPSEPAAQ